MGVLLDGDGWVGGGWGGTVEDMSPTHGGAFLSIRFGCNRYNCCLSTTSIDAR
jgi:hypothetical protein